MFGSKEEVERLLRALAERLELSGAPLVELAVCGGAALQVSGLMRRSLAATKDIDAFAVVERMGSSLSLKKCERFPEFLQREIAIVAKDFGIDDEHWLNTGPTTMFDTGVLPDGLASRLHAISYGPCLMIHYLDRYDQIHFKLWAAADQIGGATISRHLNDLSALSPTEPELEAAARWAMTHEVDPEPLKQEIKQCLRHLGHDKLAEKL